LTGASDAPSRSVNPKEVGRTVMRHLLTNRARYTMYVLQPGDGEFNSPGPLDCGRHRGDRQSREIHASTRSSDAASEFPRERIICSDSNGRLVVRFHGGRSDPIEQARSAPGRRFRLL